jgi:hypothetical protein
MEIRRNSFIVDLDEYEIFDLIRYLEESGHNDYLLDKLCQVAYAEEKDGESGLGLHRLKKGVTT